MPEGFELKKVSKLQKEAVDRFNRHENIKAALGNDAFYQVTGTLIFSILGAQLASKIITDLENRVGQITEQTKQAIKEATQVSITPPEITGPSGLEFQPQDVKVSEIIDGIIKRFGI